MQEIAYWLEQLGMSEYAQRFADERIDFSILPDLTDHDLKELGVVFGHRRKMLRAIAKLACAPEIVTPKSLPPVAAEQPVGRAGRNATLLLCNLFDASGLASNVGSDEWRLVIEAHLDAASTALMDMGGIIAKKLDDGLLALFGYHAIQENHTERAVRAALATQRTLTTLSRIHADTRRLALAARITIDSGPVVIDASGEILAAMPNIVAHAQSLAEPGAVVVTARVQRRVADLFVAKKLGSHQIKGVPEQVTLYRIVRSTDGGHRRPDYDRLLARTVKAIDMSSAEARQTAYERARNAMVAQLRFNQSALSKADIVKERLALEHAIRKVEAGAVRKWRTQHTMEPQSETTPASGYNRGASATSTPLRSRGNSTPADVPSADRPAKELADARERPASGQSSPDNQAAREFRDIHDLDAQMINVAKSVPKKREVQEDAPEDLLAKELSASRHKLDQPTLEPHEFDAPQERDLEPGYEPEKYLPAVVRPVRTPAIAPAEKYERASPPLSHGLARFLAVLIVLVGVVATISWQWSARHTEAKPQSGSGHQTPSAQASFFGGLLREQDIGYAPRIVLQGGQTVAAVAQRVVLHEENRIDQQHRHYMGSVVWRTVPVSPGVTPELAVVADAEIPERRMTVALSLRRNMDKSLPASHTIEIKFNLPADFPGGGIANVSGILMAEAEQTRGSPLAGLAVKVTDSFYVIGLTALDPETQRNEQLLKSRTWFYIPLTYTNGGRAILAIEKGPSGEHALAEAFTTWEK